MVSIGVWSRTSIPLQIGMVFWIMHLIYSVQTQQSTQQTSSVDNFLIFDDFQQFVEKLKDVVSLINRPTQSGSILEQTMKDNTDDFFGICNINTLQNLAFMAMRLNDSGVKRPIPISSPTNESKSSPAAAAKTASADGKKSTRVVILDDFLIVDDFRKYAEQHMDKKKLSYIQSGAMLEQTLRENTDAFLRLRLLPKYMRNTLNIDLSTTMLGQRVSMPIGICPNAIQQLEHSDGEKATARAAAAEGVVMILSVHSSFALEEVSASAPNGLRWLHLFNFKNSTITDDLIRRAKEAGFKAIVLAVDHPVEGFRVTYMRTKFNFNGHKFGNLEKYKSSNDIEDMKHPDLTTTWSSIQRLKGISGLPLVVKGVLTGEDAKLAVENGADAIIVSNQGGRSLDGVPATIEVLPEVVKAVNGRAEVYLDSGVRTGTDVIKALALGARAVFIGRPNLYGLFAAGENGSRKILQLLRKELTDGMHLIGAAKPSDLNVSFIKTEENCRGSRNGI